MRRLISREVPRVAIRNRTGSIFRISSARRTNQLERNRFRTCDSPLPSPNRVAPGNGIWPKPRQNRSNRPESQYRSGLTNSARPPGRLWGGLVPGAGDGELAGEEADLRMRAVA